MEALKKYVSIVPNERQKVIQDMEFYFFAHFGINTFADLEWSDGTVPASMFNPTELNCDQWCEVAVAAGAKGILLTAKHHDGFCLWQTETTEYSIKNSPYKGGKGDVVAELADACQRHGLKMGVYLSPWDRNSKLYGTPQYDDFYIAQLTELLTNYGEMFTIWLDGACGASLDGKSVQKYDFPRYYAEMLRLQPGCAISNCGPDVRWVGNEAGYCRKSEWNVVPAAAFDVFEIAAKSQQNTGEFTGDLSGVSTDLGSREVLARYEDYIWYPAEVDVSTRPGWFYHASQDRKVKSTEKLLRIYYNSVGGNCTLLLNVPPDRRGLIADNDAAVLRKMGARLRSAFAKEVAAAWKLPEGKEGFQSLGTYSPRQLADRYVLEASFAPAVIDKVTIEEDCDFSQRVESFEITTSIGGKVRTLYRGTTVGHKKIALFTPIETDNLTLTVTGCRLEPYLRAVRIYETDGKPLKRDRLEELSLRWKAYQCRRYCRWDAKQKAKARAKEAKREPEKGE